MKEQFTLGKCSLCKKRCHPSDFYHAECSEEKYLSVRERAILSKTQHRYVGIPPKRKIVNRKELEGWTGNEAY